MPGKRCSAHQVQPGAALARPMAFADYGNQFVWLCQSEKFHSISFDDTKQTSPTDSKHDQRKPFGHSNCVKKQVATGGNPNGYLLYADLLNLYVRFFGSPAHGFFAETATS